MNAIVVSIPFAVPVYDWCGFEVVQEIDVDFSVDEGATVSEQWME